MTTYSYAKALRVLAEAGMQNPAAEAGLAAFVDKMMEQGWTADIMTNAVRNGMSAAGHDAPRQTLFNFSSRRNPGTKEGKTFRNSIIRTLGPDIVQQYIQKQIRLSRKAHAQPPGALLVNPDFEPLMNHQILCQNMLVAFMAARAAMGDTSERQWRTKRWDATAQRPKTTRSTA